MAHSDPSSTGKEMSIAAVEKTVSIHSGTVHQTARGICKNLIHGDLCISAQINIDPIIDIGPISTHCISKPEIIPGNGKCAPCESCSFIVRQHICVEIPIAFGAATTADPLGSVCDGVDAGPCKCAR